MFETEKLTNNHHIITDTTDTFKAVIRMNPRDAMVFCQINISKEESIPNTLRDFGTFFYENYGGKSLIQVNQEDYDTFINAGFSETPVNADTARLMKFSNFMTIASNKQSVSYNLDKFKSQQYIMLSSPENYSDKYEALFQFKCQNATFVTQEKIEKGIYSAEAEEDKIKNEFVRYFTIVENNKIIATLMVVMHGNMAYVSDYIVRKDKRGNGLGQAIIVKAFEQLKVDKLWFIAGVQNRVTNHLYDEVFQSSIIDSKLQKEYGLFVKFGPPGPILLSAAGREKKHDHDPEVTITGNFKL